MDWLPPTELHRLDSAFYRRTQLYELVWPHERLDEYLISGTPDGSYFGAWVCGAVLTPALIRDPGKFIPVADASQLSPRIQLYTGAGQLLETFAVG